MSGQNPSHGSGPTARANPYLGNSESLAQTQNDAASQEDLKGLGNAVSQTHQQQRVATALRHRYPSSAYGCSIPLSAIFLISMALLGCFLHSSFHHQMDPKGCLMTFMQPTYYRLSGFDESKTRLAGKYGLLLYRDEGDDHPILRAGELTQTGDYDWTIAKSAKIRPTGIPALFIPGNAGSARQVRSMAKESIQFYKAGSKRIDFYSVDFNEEFSAFHGQLLLDQARYVNEAIAYILSLYDDNSSDDRFPRPTAVMIIGHSMGGIVARTVFTMDNYLPGSINTILTLATPHMVPPLALDYEITQIYDRIESFWIKGYQGGSEAALANVTLVSIMGGNQDITVNSDAGNVAPLVPHSHGFAVFTNAIPHAWVGSDHLSILWCNQIMRQVGKALAGVVDVERKEMVKEVGKRMKIFRRHLVADDGASEESQTLGRETVTLSEVSHSFEVGTLFTYPPTQTTRAAPQRHHYHILTIPRHREINEDRTMDTFDLLTNQEFGPHTDFRILLCNIRAEQYDSDVSSPSLSATVLSCERDYFMAVAIPASTTSSTWPLFVAGEQFSGQEFQSISTPLGDLAKWQYVVLQTKGDSKSGFMIAQFKNEADSIETVRTSAIGLLLNGLTRTKFPGTPSLVSTLRLPNVDNSLLAYNLKIHGGSCPSHARFQPMMKQSSWATNEDKYAVNIATKTGGVDINFHGDLPYYEKVWLRKGDHNGIELQFWRDPTCGQPLSFTLTVDKYGSLGKVVIRYRTIVLVFTFMVVVLTMRAQIRGWSQGPGTFRPFGTVMSELLRTTFWKFAGMLVLVAAMQSFKAKAFAQLVSSSTEGALTKGEPWLSSAWFDNALLGRNETFFWVLNPMFFLVAIGIVALVWVVLNTIVKITAGVMSAVTKNAGQSVHHDTGSHARTSVVLVLIAVAVPYQFAFAATVIAHIGVSARALVLAQSMSGANSQAAWDRFHFCMSVLVTLFFLLPFSVPALMVWIRNIAGGWFKSFPSDHRVDFVAPFILLVQELANSPTVTGTSWRRYSALTVRMLDAMVAYLVLFGARFSWQIYFLTRLWVSWLVLLRLLETETGKGIEGRIRRIVRPQLRGGDRTVKQE